MGLKPNNPLSDTIKIYFLKYSIFFLQKLNIIKYFEVFRLKFFVLKKIFHILELNPFIIRLRNDLIYIYVIFNINFNIFIFFFFKKKKASN